MGHAFIRLGFRTLLNDKEIDDWIHQAIKRDPIAAYEAIQSEIQLLPNESFQDEIEDLLRYANTQAVLLCDNLLKIDYQKIGKDTGKRLAQSLFTVLETPFPERITAVSPSTIVACFLNGSASSQMSLAEFIAPKLRDRTYALRGHEDAVIAWLEEINVLLKDKCPKAKTGTMRAKWLRDAIAKVEKTVDENRK